MSFLWFLYTLLTAVVKDLQLPGETAHHQQLSGALTAAGDTRAQRSPVKWCIALSRDFLERGDLEGVFYLSFCFRFSCHGDENFHQLLKALPLLSYFQPVTCTEGARIKPMTQWAGEWVCLPARSCPPHLRGRIYILQRQVTSSSVSCKAMPLSKK